MQVYLNGSIIDGEEAAISVTDRGFVFGDGIYEVVRAVDGKLFREREHLVRMQEGLNGLQIRPDPAELDRLREISLNLLRINGLLSGEATVYIQITRGAAALRTHTFPDPATKPSVYLSAAPFHPYRELHESGVDVITLQDVRWLRCNLKTINLLPNVLARQQAKDAGVNSALMIREGYVTESPNANIFGVREGILYTYPLSDYILNGITRRLVLEIAEELAIPVRENAVKEDELPELDELFFTGTTTDIQPVVEINGRALGSGAPGPVVRKIQKAFREKLYG